MTNTYLALLRGINVGGASIIAMAELRGALEKCGLQSVRTYIQSGNVFFDSSETDKLRLTRLIENCIRNDFCVAAKVVVFTKDEWQKLIAAAPASWGRDPEWKHNLLVVIPPSDIREVVAAIGDLNPDIETITPGDGALYQSMSRKLFGRTTTGKLASNPIYKRLTVRNYNTATKLLGLF